MAFLIEKDFGTQIQLENLQQIKGTSSAADLYLDEVIKLAIDEATSYLSPRYYVEKIFTETNQVFNSATNYGQYDRIYANYPAWLNNVVYTSNTYVSYNGFIYRKNNNAAPAGTLPTDVMYWIPQYKNDTIYSVKQGAAKYDPSRSYNENEIVFYYYSLFRATSPSINITPNRVYYPSWDSYFGETAYDGYFPHGYWRNYPIVLDSPTAWEIYPSTFSGGLPTDTNTWVEGDNRNHQIKQVLIDIALYHFHSRISPSNIPQLRRMRYNGDGDLEKTSAIKWLTDVAHGILNADLPEKVVPQYINRIRSEPKKVNMY